MKAMISSIFCLVLGMVLAWYFANHRMLHETSEPVEQLVQAGESSDTAEVARDLRAINLIEAGETQQAIKVLCTPLAHYYAIYETRAGESDQRSQLRSMIEKLASTNRTLATELTNQMVH